MSTAEHRLPQLFPKRRINQTFGVISWNIMYPLTTLPGQSLDTPTAVAYHLPSLDKSQGAAMDVRTIARRARLPVRKIRYVLDQRILPGLRGRLQKYLAGRPRSFTDMEGYCVACAALLLEGG